ncbi:hypothetical protein [Micrococcus sp.]|uniref:hypothetical protein n=1 Tax=Micrococcus sp. TaxID=1271 RepID=UPI002A90B20F|nr:hypothetical protein [Micrococcus sp.]MDY6055615.1 hypothetical protein [Micrococcus sp.]
MAVLLFLGVPLMLAATWYSARRTIVTAVESAGPAQPQPGEGSTSDARWAVRVHGLVTALAALPFTLLAAEFAEVFPISDPETVPQPLGGGWFGITVHPSAAGTTLMAVMAPLAVGAIHAVGSRVFPSPRGDVRRAGLAPRRLRPLLDRTLLALGGGLLTLAAALAAVLAAEPGVPRLIEPEGADAELMRTVAALRAVPAGWELLPWIGLAVLATLVTTALVLRGLARRRPVPGLTPGEDTAARWVAANRLQRTAVLVLALQLAGMWNLLVGSRTARDDLARLLPDHPAALPAGPLAPWIDAAAVGGTVALLVLAVLLALWRSPGLQVLRHGERASGTDGSPA